MPPKGSAAPERDTRSVRKNTEPKTEYFESSQPMPLRKPDAAMPLGESNAFPLSPYKAAFVVRVQLTIGGDGMVGVTLSLSNAVQTGAKKATDIRFKANVSGRSMHEVVTPSFIPRQGRKLHWSNLNSKRLPPASVVRGVEVRVQITVGSDGSVTIAMPLSKADNAIRPPRKKRRFKAGTETLREIRKYQEALREIRK